MFIIFSASCSGVLRAIVWTLQAKTETQAAACSVYALTLHVGADQNMSEGDMQLLVRSKLPPHAVSLINHTL